MMAPTHGTKHRIYFMLSFVFSTWRAGTTEYMETASLKLFQTCFMLFGPFSFVQSVTLITLLQHHPHTDPKSGKSRFFPG